MKPRVVFLFGLALCGLLLPLQVQAQTVAIDVAAGLGSGLEIGGGGGAGVVLHHSPTFTMLDIGLRLDNDQRFELGAALLLEVEGRVGVGVEPRLRINVAGKRLRPYLVAGVPIFFAPYTLYGLSIGPGANYTAWGALNIFGEVLVRAYPFGNDLPDNAALFHVDVVLGVRHAF